MEQLPNLRVNRSVIYIEDRAFLVDMNDDEAQKVAEVARRANAYPRLVEALREAAHLLEAAAPATGNPAPYQNSAAASRSLLRELGE